jgi:hypothetical protein
MSRKALAEQHCAQMLEVSAMWYHSCYDGILKNPDQDFTPAKDPSEYGMNRRR